MGFCVRASGLVFFRVSQPCLSFPDLSQDTVSGNDALLQRELRPTRMRKKLIAVMKSGGDDGHDGDKDEGNVVDVDVVVVVDYDDGIVVVLFGGSGSAENEDGGNVGGGRKNEVLKVTMEKEVTRMRAKNGVII